MSEVECPRCGSSMRYGGVCPVCQIPHNYNDGRAPIELAEPKAPTLLGRLWQSGQAALLVACMCFAAGIVAPIVQLQRLHLPPQPATLNAWQVIVGEGLYAVDLKSTAMMAVPGAAVAMLSFLISRRQRAVMVASRPLVFVVALLPICSAVLLMLRIAKHERFEYHYLPGFWLILLGSISGMWGAIRFGRGAHDTPTASHQDDHDEL